MTAKHMKSDQVRREFADVLQFVRTGGTVIVEHYNKPIATITPYEEPSMPARVYIRETDEGTETTKVFRTVNEIREVYEVDGEVVDDSLVYADSDPDEYLRRRDMELRGEGYRKS